MMDVEKLKRIQGLLHTEGSWHGVNALLEALIEDAERQAVRTVAEKTRADHLNAYRNVAGIYTYTGKHVIVRDHYGAILFVSSPALHGDFEIEVKQ